ncbi:MAG: hypothetical protein M1840_000698 [Geoglossum simile]|nr:MAG: hypothetical protein M1840_000698 [Geoglossum simile]
MEGAAGPADAESEGVAGGEGVAEDEKNTLLYRLQQLYEYEPRREQVEAIHTLVYERRDLILSARTGWGKSMIFQSIPVFRNGGIYLMIMPFNALEEEQAQSIDQIPSCRSCVLNGKSNSHALRRRIRDGEFTHVLTSPEIALGKDFLTVLRDSEFQDWLVLVAIDEIRRGIPWFRTSATLDPVMLESVKKLAGFDNPKEIHTSLDRPDIFINVQCLQFPANSHKDLHFLIPSPSPISMLPKTIVYVEQIAELVMIVQHLRRWSLAEKDKRLTFTEFIKSDSVYRIIIATDAMRMGVNNPDVLRVIQWK